MPNMNNFEQLNNNFNEVNSKINNNILIQNNNKYDNIIRFPINSNVNYLNTLLIFFQQSTPFYTYFRKFALNYNPFFNNNSFYLLTSNF